MPRIVAIAVLGLVAAVCGPAAAQAAVRINQIQTVGTHNSYHLEASPPEKALRSASGLIDESTLEYGFAPITQQLDTQGVRQLELDVWVDPAGGAYAAPRLRALAGEGPYDPAMALPGIKVLHVQDYDYRTMCLSLAACLQEVKAWSDAHRGHVPLAILIELKDTALTPLPATIPLPWTSVPMDALDAEIRAVFPPERLIVPDDVRGRRRTLEAAVLRDGWPTLAASRGKVLFLMDNAAPYRARYLGGHPSLRGRVLFTSSAPGLPEAAFIKANDPSGANLARIRRAVRLGYVVRTRADADTREARSGDTRRARRALATGAQWVSTDYPAAGMAARFGTDYVVRLPRPARCNPVNAPRGCRGGRLDRAR